MYVGARHESQRARYSVKFPSDSRKSVGRLCAETVCRAEVDEGLIVQIQQKFGSKVNIRVDGMFSSRRLLVFEVKCILADWEVGEEQ